MKRKSGIFLLTALAMLLMLAAACEKGPEDLIIGRWLFQSYHWSLSLGDSLINESTSGVFGIDYVEVYENGFLEMAYSDSLVLSMEWAIRGDSLFMYPPDEDVVRARIRSLDREELVLENSRYLVDERKITESMTFRRDD